MKKFLKCENGQSVVETALTLPIILVILCGIIDFGWLFLGQLSTNNCAREAARYATINSTNANISLLTSNRILNIAPDNIKENLSIKVTLSNPSNPRSGDVTVEVKSIIKALTFVGSTIYGNNTVNINSKVTMKAE